MTAISTAAMWFNQRTANNALQSQVTLMMQEASSGVYANPAVEIGAKNTTLYNLQTQYAQQTTIQTAATSVGNKLTTMQTALTAMNVSIGTITTQALATSTAAGSQSTEFSVAATEATNTMDQLMQQLNTTYNGQFVFSGQDSGTQTMASNSSAAVSTIQTMLTNAVASNGGAPLSSGTLSNLETSLNNMFSDSSGSPSTNYSGAFFTATDNGNPVTASIGGGQTISYDMKGSSQAMKDTFHGLAMLALLNSSSSQLDDTAKSQLATEATTLLNKGQSQLTAQTAMLGAKQAQLTTIADTQSAAASATQLQISSIDEVDETSLATMLSATRTQLQASYQITSQISSLSFTNYMK